MSELNIEWVKCPHGIEKRSLQSCPECEKIKNDFYTSIHKGISEPPKRIPIFRGCHSAQNGGCFCNGSCKEVIGYRDLLYPGER